MLDRETLLRLSAADRSELISSLSEEEAAVLMYSWEFWAREAQMAPQEWLSTTGLKNCWLLLAGRGFGKTKTGAETLLEVVQRGMFGRIALVAETAADARDVIVEGDSGILRCAPPWFRPLYEPSKRKITFPNGAIALTYNAVEPDQLRGPQFDFAWCDELAKWRYVQETWDNLQFGLRLERPGRRPLSIVTTTPRPIKLIRELVADDTVFVTRGNTLDNSENLAASFIKAVRKKYEGTRLGRQELNAEILDDMPGALWTRDVLERAYLKKPDGPVDLTQFVRIVVAIDPAVSNEEGSDETGIVVVGQRRDDRGVVIEDASGRMSPMEWATRAVTLYRRYQADRIIAEVNNGGDMVETTIRMVDANVAYRAVHASKGKVARAEPVSALYEQGRILHLGGFAELEDQMSQFTRDFDRKTMGYSPDRVDALVWGLTELMGIESGDGRGIFDFYRQEADTLAQKEATE